MLPLGSAILSLVFAAMVFDQWLQRRHSFQLVWAIGLLCYALSTGAEFAGGAFGWTDPIYRTWYFFGTFLVPSYLGAGTFYLLNRTRFGHLVAVSVILGGVLSVAVSSKYAGSTTAAYVTLAASIVMAAAITVSVLFRRELQASLGMTFLAAGTVLIAILVASAEVSGTFVDPATHAPVASAMPGYLRVSSFPFTVGGGLSLVFGALYSAYIYMPKKRVLAARLAFLAIVVNFFASLPNAVAALLTGKLNSRVPATILIAIGAFIPGSTSSLNRLGITWATFLGEFLGVLLIFIGFLVSEEVFRNLRLGRTFWSRGSFDYPANSEPSA